MRDYRELVVYQAGKALALSVYRETGYFPKVEMFGLVSQMRRCAMSITSNIAEGCSRDSQKDFVRFIEIALGSSMELSSQIEIATELKFFRTPMLQTFASQRRFPFREC